MTVSRVGVIGAGQMGNGIAHVMALAGYNVVLNDIDQMALDKSVEIIEMLIEASPEALSIASDSDYSNLPLHVVCSRQNPIFGRNYACADMILFIYYQFPDAIAIHNAQGFTPREIVERENHPEKMKILRVFDTEE